MNQKILKGTDITILTLGSSEYLGICPPDAQPQFLLHPGAHKVEPTVELFTMTEDEIVNIDEDYYISGSTTTVCKSLISPRPRNIVKR